MRQLTDMKIIFKVAIPFFLIAAVTVGITLYARTILNDLAQQTQSLVDVQATRLESILSVQIHVNEASVQGRNIIIETRQREMAAYKARYDATVKDSLDIAAKLIALSDTPERKMSNEKLADALREFYAVTDRSIELGLRNENDAAGAILLREGSTLAREGQRHRPAAGRPADLRASQGARRGRSGRGERHRHADRRHAGGPARHARARLRHRRVRHRPAPGRPGARAGTHGQGRRRRGDPGGGPGRRDRRRRPRRGGHQGDGGAEGRRAGGDRARRRRSRQGRAQADDGGTRRQLRAGGRQHHRHGLVLRHGAAGHGPDHDHDRDGDREPVHHGGRRRRGGRRQRADGGCGRRRTRLVGPGDRPAGLRLVRPRPDGGRRGGSDFCSWWTP